MITPGRCLTALWLSWALLWLVLARWSDKTLERQPVKDRLAHSLPTVAGVYLLAANAPFGWRAMPAFSTPRGLSWACVGAAALGIAWMIWARLHLGRLWSGIVTFKAGHKVVRSGPYALTRHPIYTGLLLALLATALWRATWPAFAAFALLLASFRLKIRQEEALLIGRLGEEYRAYQKEVPALVPRPRRRSPGPCFPGRSGL